MSADILRPDGSLDAWIYPPDHGLVLVAPHTSHSYHRTSSPIVRPKILDRPKSVPATLGSRLGRQSSARSGQQPSPYGSSRPKTATGSIKADCSRVNQVEHEPTRKQNLENHLPTRKIKPPPWQKALDMTPVPCVVSPGYTLSRSKHKVAMTINTDSFFDSEPGDHEPHSIRYPSPLYHPLPGSVSIRQRHLFNKLLHTRPNSQVVSKIHLMPQTRLVSDGGYGREAERDPLVAQLQQQIDDLTLYLEEERLNHRDTKRKAAEQLDDKIDEMNKQHEHQMSLLEEEFQEQIESLKESNAKDIESLTDSSEEALSKMHGEIEFLQGAFESYKSQLHMEMDERWNKREAELKEHQEDLLHEKLKELRSKVQLERASEKLDLSQSHQRDILSLKQEHKKEINQILRRFSNAAKDLEDYKKTQEELEERTQELESLKEDYDSVCHQTAELTRQLTDMKVELVIYEQTFQDRVQGIDEKYKNQLHELMMQNTELRRLYVKKCGELFDEKVETEKSQIDTLQTAKDVMKTVIETRNEAFVNLAATDPEYDNRVRKPKHRPASAPYTRSETEQALLSAGETDDIVKQRDAKRVRPETCKPRILQQIQQEREELDESQDKENKNVQKSLLDVSDSNKS